MHDKIVSRSREKISPELTSLSSLPIKELKQQWRSLYGSEPPLRISRELLIRAVAYRIQEQAVGGLKLSRADCWCASPTTRVTVVRSTYHQAHRCPRERC